MVDGVNNVHSSSNEDPKKKILTEPLKASKIEISMVSADALKEDIELKGWAIESSGPDLVNNKKERKKAIKMRRDALREELDISKRNARRLAKNDVKSDIAEEIVTRSTYYIDEEEYNKAVAKDPNGHHVLLDDKYKKVLNSRMFDEVYEGRKRDKQGNIVEEGKLNSDKLKSFALELVGEDDYKLDLDENVAGAAQTGLTNKKGKVRRKDARILRHMFRDMGFAYEKDKTAGKRALHVAKNMAMGAATGALISPVVSEVTGWLGVSGAVKGVVDGFVVGQVSGTVSGTVNGIVNGKADYSGSVDYTADYGGSVDYNAEYGGSVDYGGSVNYGGSVDYGGSVNYGGSVDYGGSVNYGGSVDYGGSFDYGGSADYGGSVNYGGSVDSTAYYIENGKVIGSDTQTYEYGGSFDYGGSIDYGGSVNYGGSVDYGGSVNYGGSVDYGGSVNYGGSVDYGGSVNYGGSVDYGGSVNYGGSADYGGSVNYGGSVDYHGNVSGRVDYNGQVSGSADYKGSVDYSAEYSADYTAEYTKDYKAEYKKEYKADYNTKPSWGQRMKTGALSGALGAGLSSLVTMWKINDIKNPPTVDVLQGGSVDEFVDKQLVGSVKGKTSRAIAKKLFELDVDPQVLKDAIKDAMGKNTGKRLTENELFQVYQKMKNLQQQPVQQEEAPDMPEITPAPLIVPEADLDDIEIEPVPIQPATVEETQPAEEVAEDCEATAEPIMKDQAAPEKHIDIRGKFLYDAIAKAYDIKDQDDLNDAIGIVKEKHNISQAERKKNKWIADLYLEEQLKVGEKTYNLNKDLKREDILDIPKDQFKPGEGSKGHKTPTIQVEAGGKVTLSCDGQIRTYDTYLQAQKAADFYNKNGYFEEDMQ